MGEVLFFYFLIVSTRNSATEQQVIDTVLGWSSSPVTIPPELAAGLSPGIANPGQYFHSSRPYQVGFLIEFVENWKENGPNERQRLLDSPWEFKRFASQIKFRSRMLANYPQSPRTQKEALLHLVFPDTFQAIVSWNHKNKIAETFAEYVIGRIESFL